MHPYQVPKTCLVAAIVLAFAPVAAAQIYGNGHDGALAPITDVVLDTSLHGGVFEFTSIAVPFGVTVHLVGSNPAVLLCQGSVTIAGKIEADGKGSVWGATQQSAQAGGPGGFGGGTVQNGFGPGGGHWGQGILPAIAGGSASHATAGMTNNPFVSAAATYGSALPFDLLGGSGGGAPGQGNASSYGPPASGGGGTIVILAEGAVQVSGVISARGGDQVLGIEYYWSLPPGTGGLGSGGSILVRSLQCLRVSGTVDASGGSRHFHWEVPTENGGSGIVRLDSYTACGSPDLTGALIRPAPTVAPLPFLLELEPAHIGQTYRVRCASAPGDMLGLYWSLGSQSTSVPPFGVLLLDPSVILFLGQHAVPVTGSDPLAAIDIPVPNDASLVGITIYSQAFNAFGTVTGAARLSNLLVTTIGG